MAKGDQKRRVMEKRQLDEPGYYAFASVVGLQRHFNVQTAKLLQSYGFDPLGFLDSQSKQMPDTIGPGNYEQWLTEECDCPMTLLRAYVADGGGAEPDESLAGLIAAELVPTTLESLARWSDPNHFTPRLLKAYTAPAGTPLDEQAINLSRGRDVEVADLVDFILAHPAGRQSYRPPLSLSQRICLRFEAVAGFRLSEHYATTLLATISSRYQVRAEQLENPPF